MFSDAQRVFNDWSKLDAEDRTTDRILQMLDYGFFELLDAVTVARSRKHIRPSTTPQRLVPVLPGGDPVSIHERLTDLPNAPGFNDIAEQRLKRWLAVYTPLPYGPKSACQVRRPLQRHGRVNAQVQPGRRPASRA